MYSFTEDEWKEFKLIMRQLTWGKECMDRWWGLVRKVEKRVNEDIQCVPVNINVRTDALWHKLAK
jgi:hypothetical protein